jgi:hypothetical protein
VIPGQYSVKMSKVENGKITDITPAQTFSVEALNLASLPAADKKAVNAFGQKTADLYKAVTGTNAYTNEMINKLKFIREAIFQNRFPDKF